MHGYCMKSQRTQQKFARIVAKYRPRGWKIVETAQVPRDAGGLTVFGNNRIYCPFVVDAYSLQVYLHEVAHVKLRHRWTPKPRYVQEYEAEMWSFAALVNEGFPITQKMLKQAKFNVYNLVVKSINMEAVKWSITR